MTALTPLHLTSPTLSLTAVAKGATVTALRLGPSAPNLLLGFKDPAEHFRNAACLGSVVGPVANRIAEGRLSIDGQTYQMPRNENGVTCLHSGPEGLHMCDWEVLSHSATHLRLGLTLADGANGLPGDRVIEASYAIDGLTLSVVFEARTDRPTPINIAWHPYWTLGHEGDVSGLTLEMASDHYLPTDGLGLPTGERRDVTGTDFDFRRARPVPRAAALDVNFCLAQRPRAAPVRAARLSAPDGTTVEIETTAPGLQVYAGAGLPEMAGALSEGGSLAPYGGLAMEPQLWPDAPNQPGFAPITLRPGELWRQETRYHFTPPQ